MVDDAIVSHRRNMSARSNGSSNPVGRREEISPQSQLRRIQKTVASRKAPRNIQMRGGAERKRSSSAPARMGRKRHLLVEDHYRVDPDNKVLLPGLPVNDDDWERDLHDFFNLVSLIPVVVLNVMNWNWDILLDPNNRKTLQYAWTGEWFSLFYAVVIAYFFADLIWVTLIPKCVKSPGVIIQHHIATLAYLIIPYRFPEEGWLMGACLSVEVNTWLLIARRVFNKQGFPPWVIDLPPFFSIRVKLISILFYSTWISIRCLFYPIIMKLLCNLWIAQWNQTGTIFRTRYAVALLLHSIFCVLNFKWTFDLFMSKFRAWQRGTPSKVQKGL